MEESSFRADAPPALAVGAVLSRASGVLKKNLGLFCGLTVLSLIPAFVMEVFLPPDLLVTLAAQFSSMLLAMFIQGAMAYGVYRTLQGERVTMRGCLAYCAERLGPLLLTAGLVSLGIMLGLAVLVVPGLILWCMWSVAVPACVVERLSATGGMARSAELTKGVGLKIFGILLLCILFMVAVMLAPAFAAELLMPGTIASDVVSYITFIVPQAFYDVVVAVIYFSLRESKEGVSLDSLADVFD